jgi:hypothetical protein
MIVHGTWEPQKLAVSSLHVPHDEFIIIYGIPLFRCFLFATKSGSKTNAQPSLSALCNSSRQPIDLPSPITAGGNTHSSFFFRLFPVLFPAAHHLVFLIMLALSSPISNLHSKYSSGLAPGVQFALDLTDNTMGMSEKEAFLFSAPQDTATLRPLAEGSSPFGFQRQVAARLGDLSLCVLTLDPADLRNGSRPTTILSQENSVDATPPNEQSGRCRDCRQRYIVRLVDLQQARLERLSDHCPIFHSHQHLPLIRARTNSKARLQGRIRTTKPSQSDAKARTASSFKADPLPVEAILISTWKPKIDERQSSAGPLPATTLEGGPSTRTNSTVLLNCSLYPCPSKSTHAPKHFPRCQFTSTLRSRMR